ncbi:MAG: hypothetical protein ACK53T_00235 [Planctomycetota bacterium]|jgi:DNA-directed RNA polymerase sigma subunit (sigma70/sigma32)
MPKYNPQSMADRKEVPSGTGFHANEERISLAERVGLYDTHHLPMNPYQALMEADCLEEPVLDQETAALLWEAFQEKIDGCGLTDRERVVVDCIVWGGMSLSQTGEYVARHEGVNKAFSKQHIQRIRDKAYEKLRAVFQEETS